MRVVSLIVFLILQQQHWVNKLISHAMVMVHICTGILMVLTLRILQVKN